MFRNFNNNIYIIIFYILEVFLILCSLLIIYTTRTLRIAMLFCFVVLINSCFYLLLGAEFIAIVQILVYISGITVLLIFVIMLTDIQPVDNNETPKIKKIISFITSILFFFFNVLIILCLISKNIHVPKTIISYNDRNIAALGFKILDFNQNGYVLPFELISVLLLVILVGCLKISRK